MVYNKKKIKRKNMLTNYSNKKYSYWLWIQTTRKMAYSQSFQSYKAQNAQ